MAVIREKRQFQIGPVSVARADTGGRYTAQQMINSGNELSSMLFQKLAQKAEKAGLEAGQAVERQKVMTINPSTGKPEAYDAPSSFGGIASEAYQRVVMNRFQSSIEDEMQNKARELAVQYEDNPNGANLYGEAMASYIASMANSAEGMFQTYINDVGTHYLQSTQTSMAIGQVRRERAAAARSAARSTSEALDMIEFTVANEGPDSLAEGGTASNIIAGGGSVVSDASASGLMESDAGTAYSRETKVRVTQGLIRHAAGVLAERGSDGIAALDQLEAAIGTQNPALIPEEFAALRENYASLGSDYSAMAAIESMSDGLLSDQSKYMESVARREQAQLQLENDLMAWRTANNADEMYRQGVNAAASPFSSTSLATGAARAYLSQFDNAQAFAASGDNTNANSLIASAERQLEGAFEGLALRTVSGLTRDETDQLELAYTNRNVALAPESSRSHLSAIFALEQATGKPYEGFDSYVSSYRDSPAKAIEAMKQAQVEMNVGRYIDPMIAGIAAGIYSPETVRARAIEAGASGDYLVNLNKQIDREGAYGALATVFSNNLTAVQVNDAQDYYDGINGAGGTLTPAMRQSLDQAKLYATSSESGDSVRSRLGDLGRKALDRVAEQQKAIERQSELETALLYGGDPSSIDDRRLFSEALSIGFAPALNGRTLEQVFADPNSISDPSLQPLFNRIKDVGVLPQELVSRMKGLASGNTTNALTTMQYFQNFQTDYGTTGPILSSAVSEALTDDEYATLTYIAASANGQTGNLISTNADIARLLENKRIFTEEQNGQRIIESVLGGSMPDFIASLKDSEDYPVSYVDAATAMAYHAIASGERSASVIRDLVENQMEAKYPVSDGIVMTPLGSGRSLITIDSAVGSNNADDFKEIIATRYAQSTGRLAAFGWNPTAMFKGAPTSEMGLNASQYDQLFLMPVTPANSTDVSFAVYRRVEGDMDPQLVMEEITAPSNGGIETVQAPMIISVNDREFRARLAVTRNQYVTDAIAKRSFIEQLSEFSGVQ